MKEYVRRIARWLGTFVRRNLALVIVLAVTVAAAGVWAVGLVRVEWATSAKTPRRTNESCIP